MPRECVVLGTPCFVGGLAEAGRNVIERAATGRGGYVCQANAHVLVTGCRDQRVRRALDDAWVVHPDGWPVAWLARRLGMDGAERIGGGDLMSLVFDLGQASGLTHFLFGSTPAVVRELEVALLQRYPRARIVGRLSPPFSPSLEQNAPRAVATIREANADVVWCALGAPKQEMWMHRHAASVRPAVVIGVGAAFDFLAGMKSRAPGWMQRRGLEWAHRLCSEPRRLAGRYLRTNPEFVVRAGLELARQQRPQ
jgi:N-acetylglucosaminyldiphosphoundecaprenol N-acetyl-beta-D-mannosaminyltransferase